MFLQEFVQKSFQAVKRGYDSDLSKKLGIFKHPAIRTSYREFKMIRGAVHSRKLRSLYAQGLLDGMAISTMIYQDLEYVKQYDTVLFKEIAEKIHSVNIDLIGEKPKITIGFFISNSASWCCGRLYHLFEASPRFEPVILVCGSHDGTDNFRKDTYRETLTYFKENGYRTIGLWDHSTANWDAIGCPDIIFLLTPYEGTLPATLNIFHIPLSTLLVYIPYAILSDKLDWWFDSPGPQLSWIYFCETSAIRDMIGKMAILGNSNVVVSGHPKMDPLIHPLIAVDSSNIWKISPMSSSLDGVRKILYTPHQSINEGKNNSSTFHLNHHFFYNYAKEHLDTTSWIIKPHPLLRSRSVECGLFASEEEYDAYMDLWDALPNAKTVRYGEYTDLFLTSDAMITDSGSFLTEYLGVNKPIILLTRGPREYNDWGSLVQIMLYQVPGSDLQGISDMIDTVILCQKDPLQECRTKFYEKYFQRSSDEENDSCTFIYKYISSCFN